MESNKNYSLKIIEYNKVCFSKYITILIED